MRNSKQRIILYVTLPKDYIWIINSPEKKKKSIIFTISNKEIRNNDKECQNKINDFLCICFKSKKVSFCFQPAVDASQNEKNFTQITSSKCP